MKLRDDGTDLQGIIVVYSTAIKGGVIKGKDGKNYVFERDDWLSVDETPRDGLLARFTARHQRASQIVVSQNEFIRLSPAGPTAQRG